MGVSPRAGPQIDLVTRESYTECVIVRTGTFARLRPEPGTKVLVFGDIHGDLASLEAGLALVEDGDTLVFLGDYADRGPHGVEVIERIDDLVHSRRDRVVALLGNHEVYSKDGRPSFRPCTLVSEATDKRGSWAAFFKRFSSFVSQLSLAALLPGAALFVHGGVGPECTSAEVFAHPSQSVFDDVLWSDPGAKRGLHPSRRGIGHVFGIDVSRRVIEALGVVRVIRSHEPRKAASGPVEEHDGAVMTVSSTDVYGGRPHVVEMRCRRSDNGETADGEGDGASADDRVDAGTASTEGADPRYSCEIETRYLDHG